MDGLPAPFMTYLCQCIYDAERPPQFAYSTSVPPLPLCTTCKLCCLRHSPIHARVYQRHQLQGCWLAHAWVTRTAAPNIVTVIYIYLCIAYSMLFINCSCWCHSPFWQPMPSAFCRMLQKAAEYINVTPLRIRAKRQLLLFDCISYPPSMYLLVDESFSMAALYNRCMPG